METKPFSIQSPEQIAKDYGGNKQKIAEAMRLGIVQPTPGVLAGMFIDRMRAAQMQEQAPQNTVAQQVMGGLPPAPAQVPPAPQPGAPAGLGAIAPQGEAPMPEAPMPMEASTEEAPMGMAMGGLADLPVPDDMFDEPSNGGFNDGYAGGGLVAFAGGGTPDLNAFRRAIIAQESGGRYGIANRDGSGAMGIGQIMPDTARALAKRLGREYRPDLLAGTSKEAQEYQNALTAAATEEAWNYGKGDPKLAAAYYFAGPNKKGWGEKTARYQDDILRRLGADDGTSLPEREMGTAQGRFSSLLDQMGVVNELYDKLPEDKGRKEAIEYYEKQRSPEERKKALKDDMWATLAQVGASLATTPGSFLFGLGKALGDALPGAEASRKERKAAEREAVTALSELYGMDRKEAKEKMAMALDLRNIEVNLAKDAEDRQLRRELTAAELASRAEDREATLAAAALRANNPDKFDLMLAAYRKSYPNFSEVAILKQMKKDGLIGSSGQNMALPGDTTSGNESDNSGMTILGSRPAQ